MGTLYKNCRQKRQEYESESEDTMVHAAPTLIFPPSILDGPAGRLQTRRMTRHGQEMRMKQARGTGESILEGLVDGS